LIAATRAPPSSVRKQFRETALASSDLVAGPVPRSPGIASPALAPPVQKEDALMIPMQPMLIDVTPALAPVMLAVALAMAGSAATFVYEALRSALVGGRSRSHHRTARLAA
jgi:hypothetical protein